MLAGLVSLQVLILQVSTIHLAALLFSVPMVLMEVGQLPTQLPGLKHQFPEAVVVWRVALKARAITGRDITAWNVAAGADGTTFTTLLTSTTVLLGTATAPPLFQYFYNYCKST